MGRAGRARYPGAVSDEQRGTRDPEGRTAERNAPASTPFDNPVFLPVLLWLFAAWFGYDTFADTEAGTEWPWFNRIGFVVTLVLAIYYTVQARRAREASPSAGDSSGGE